METASFMLQYVSFLFEVIYTSYWMGISLFILDKSVLIWADLKDDSNTSKTIVMSYSSDEKCIIQRSHHP